MMDTDEALHSAEKMLAEQGIHFEVSADELGIWCTADTPWPDMPLDVLMLRPLLVAHELVEISEIKKMGLKITKSVIIENPARVYEAHLKAFEVELMLARRQGDWRHIGQRILDAQKWMADPLLPTSLKPRCQALIEEAQKSLRFRR